MRKKSFVFVQTREILGEISGSHGGWYEDHCYPVCCVLMVEVVSISETSADFYRTARRSILEASSLLRNSSAGLL
jgi:hypothetical protein